MDNDKVNEALRACDAIICEKLGAVQAVQARHAQTVPGRCRHLRWMIAEALSWPAERIEKKFRWLGFVQGVLWRESFVAIDTLKAMNMPSDIDDTHLSPDGK